MDPTELIEFLDMPVPELAEMVPDLVELVPIEVLPVGSIPVHAADWFTRILRFFSQYALMLAFGGAMIENTILLGFLLPGGAVVALSAAGARAANIPLPYLVVLAAAGMTCGAVVDYYLGRAGIHQLLHHRWTGRVGRNLAEQLNQATPLLRRHGWWVMLCAHAFGHGRSALALAAGASNFGLRRFLVIEIPAATLWAAVYAGGGYFLAAEWHTFELIIRRAGWIGAGLTAIGVTGWLLWRRHQLRALKAAAIDAAHGTPPPDLALDSPRNRYASVDGAPRAAAKTVNALIPTGVATAAAAAGMTLEPAHGESGAPPSGQAARTTAPVVSRVDDRTHRPGANGDGSPT